jgi:hypothetical protein
MSEVTPASAPAPRIFSAWSDQQTADWGHRPLDFATTLHQLPLFSDDVLSDLIDQYPKESYALVSMGARDERRQYWREGETGELSGRQVMERIAAGRMWLNLRNVSDVDQRYNAILDQLFAEISERVPDLKIIRRSMGILISSPNAQVYYHADLPGQALAQIRGSKRIYIYPPEEPFLTEKGLENIALHGLEVDLAYDPAFDADATVFDLTPGQLLHWPLNGPHRVENHDSLNISITIEYLTPEIRRHQIVTSANGLMRQKLGFKPRSRSIVGASYWAKAMLQAGARRSGWLGRQHAKKRPITFRLDPSVAGGMRDIGAEQQ